ncbi:hypothetical protein PR048_010515 [Dryococelus australis]|uniref:Uncharacterized protein n=1 Tax=Dryococelus australis TaxID=614101 RepID=A0ABQ9I3T4_9NEOP|nr:hypothetical protein PR048_010515 [Dryococelus australis]
MYSDHSQASSEGPITHVLWRQLSSYVLVVQSKPCCSKGRETAHPQCKRVYNGSNINMSTLQRPRFYCNVCKWIGISVLAQQTRSTNQRDALTLFEVVEPLQTQLHSALSLATHGIWQWMCGSRSGIWQRTRGDGDLEPLTMTLTSICQAEEYTTVDVKQGFQECSLHHEQPINCEWTINTVIKGLVASAPHVADLEHPSLGDSSSSSGHKNSPTCSSHLTSRHRSARAARLLPLDVDLGCRNTATLNHGRRLHTAAILQGGAPSQIQAEQLYRELYPDKTPPSRRVFSLLIVKLCETGNFNRQQCNRRRTRTDEAAEVAVVAAVAVNPHNRKEFCQWAQHQIIANPNFFPGVVFTDELSFSSSGQANTRNMHYWEVDYPRWLQQMDHQRQSRVNIWCGMVDNTSSESILKRYSRARNVADTAVVRDFSRGATVCFPVFILCRCSTPHTISPHPFFGAGRNDKYNPTKQMDGSLALVYLLRGEEPHWVREIIRTKSECDLNPISDQGHIARKSNTVLVYFPYFPDTHITWSSRQQAGYNNASLLRIMSTLPATRADLDFRFRKRQGKGRVMSPVNPSPLHHFTGSTLANWREQREVFIPQLVRSHGGHSWTPGRADLGGRRISQPACQEQLPETVEINGRSSPARTPSSLHVSEARYRWQARSPSTEANRVPCLVQSLPDFNMWKSCRTMPLRCSIPTSLKPCALKIPESLKPLYSTSACVTTSRHSRASTARGLEHKCFVQFHVDLTPEILCEECGGLSTVVEFFTGILPSPRLLHFCPFCILSAACFDPYRSRTISPRTKNVAERASLDTRHSLPLLSSGLDHLFPATPRPCLINKLDRLERRKRSENTAVQPAYLQLCLRQPIPNGVFWEHYLASLNHAYRILYIFIRPHDFPGETSSRIEPSSYPQPHNSAMQRELACNKHNEILHTRRVISDRLLHRIHIRAIEYPRTQNRNSCITNSSRTPKLAPLANNMAETTSANQQVGGEQSNRSATAAPPPSRGSIRNVSQHTTANKTKGGWFPEPREKQPEVGTQRVAIAQLALALYTHTCALSLSLSLSLVATNAAQYGARINTTWRPTAPITSLLDDRSEMKTPRLA